MASDFYLSQYSKPFRRSLSSLQELLAPFALFGANGDMYDVLEPLKRPPSECGSDGCELDDSPIEGIWAVPDNAAKANFPGQLRAAGKIVESRTNGAWCFCKENTTEGLKNGDYPFSNKTVYLFNTAEGADLFVSYADTDSPPGLKGGSVVTCRLYHTDQRNSRSDDP